MSSSRRARGLDPPRGSLVGPRITQFNAHGSDSFRYDKGRAKIPLIRLRDQGVMTNFGHHLRSSLPLATQAKIPEPTDITPCAGVAEWQTRRTQNPPRGR